MDQLVMNVNSMKSAFKTFANLEVWDTVGELLKNLSGGENFDDIQFELLKKLGNKTLEQAKKARLRAEKCGEESDMWTMMLIVLVIWFIGSFLVVLGRRLREALEGRPRRHFWWSALRLVLWPILAIERLFGNEGVNETVLRESMVTVRQSIASEKELRELRRFLLARMQSYRGESGKGHHD